ncbi:DeoR/GlpR family DNA-binding transcription regulator [Salibacterium halotolerans]|uniref:DNA-binding transcriptional regulator of sugar metabolism, DeoR/GlpR family n=1 Tax=Salibacterium halotolerans TaxID=1884432 RepID=A0A1I5PT34_9BACI|nr:DeoR/GlpR family DNA-binding transcription regulator [Salibacterium halotolerans]SFP36711.1 DNA-binding transcriptional regulator of sugar metabolism, DeoR/GlpR family [Salibacterium halotolerans]
MNVDERRAKIIEVLNQKKRLDIENLTDFFDVSTMTIRRDLAQLEKDGEIIRTHGGAVTTDSEKEETPYLQKESANKEEKKAIASKAAGMVHPHATIILDSGTTTLELAKCLKEKENLRIITNDILIAAELLYSPVDVIVAGGELQREVGAMFGTYTQDLIASLHVDQFFLGAHSVDTAGVTAPTLEKARIKQLMMESAAETWLLADSSKFGQKSFAHVSTLNKLDGIMSDNGLHNTETIDLYHENVMLVDGKRGWEDEDWNDRR